MPEDLFGKKGIDTPYERSLIDGKPKLERTKDKGHRPLDMQTRVNIDRSRDFTISQAIGDYQELISRIDELLAIIEKRNQTQEFRDYQVLLKDNSKKQDLFLFENQHSGYQGGTEDYEIYTILTMMKASLIMRSDFLTNYYASQISDKTELEDIQKDELKSINQWELAEDQLMNYVSPDYEDADDELDADYSAIEDQRRDLSNFHISLADTGYVHRNRYKYFDTLVLALDQLVNHPTLLFTDDMKTFMLQLTDFSDLTSAMTHLILAFREVRTDHESIKQQYYMSDDQKEQLINEQGYFFQQIKIKMNPSLNDDLMNQDDETNQVFNDFAELMVSSIQKTEKNYTSVQADLLRFYAQENAFYGQQIGDLQKEEKIRRFYHILEDMSGTKDISEEWIDQYLKNEGYTL